MLDFNYFSLVLLKGKIVLKRCNLLCHGANEKRKSVEEQQSCPHTSILCH
jgi:hypothetical protein